MKVGLFTTNQQLLATDMVKALDEQIAMVHLARDSGWDSLFSGQHYLNEGDNKQLQLVPFLTRLMPEAGDMTTGLGVMLINLHNPVYIAETVATLDIIAGVLHRDVCEDLDDPRHVGAGSSDCHLARDYDRCPHKIAQDRFPLHLHAHGHDLHHLRLHFQSDVLGFDPHDP